MKLNLTISIDDCCPKPGWNILGTPVEKWLRSLNEEFGAKFTLFCPSNYHQEYPISKHHEWIKELNSIPYFELAAHGHFHQTSDPKRFGECEFAEINLYKDVGLRLYEMWSEWYYCGIIPVGWRNPGWLCSEGAKSCIERVMKVEGFGAGEYEFKYVALHYEHNHGMQWNCKTFFGHDGIHQTDIGIHNQDMIMFQSHIAGDWNDNVWNERNYDQLRLSLEHLCNEHQIEFKTLKECL